ncbi:carbon-nitrogen hydrolase family protein [Trinickia sp. YCB016]
MGMSHPNFKAAVVQAAPVFLDLDGAVDRAVSLIAEAGREGAQLIAFPETWIPGYPSHIWLGSPAWAMEQGFVQRYFDNALQYGTPQAERISSAAAAHKITVSLGFAERDGGSLYIAQWLIGPDGQTISRRRKLKPTHVERTVFGEGDGSDLAVLDTALGRIGSLSCWEHLQPLSKYAMYAQNEQIHIGAWPSFSLYQPFANALGPEVNIAVSRVYAVEGQCFFLAPCATVSESMIQALCDTPEKHGLIRAGGGHAAIFGPDGRLLTPVVDDTYEGLLYADLDLGVISIAKSAADPAGHYSRPDVTRLLLNRTPSKRVQEMTTPFDTVSDPELLEQVK